MITCKHCQAQQFEGSIFCNECGASLAMTSARQETTASLGRSDTSDLLEADTIFGRAPSGMTINFLVVSSGRRLSLGLAHELTIGRRDARGSNPDLDLTVDGGSEAGVSRRHAVIRQVNGRSLIEDLASTNGTFINGNRILPNQPMPLHNGDEVSFGTLSVRIDLPSAE